MIDDERAVPKTAMVFAAGLGKRMRPITNAHAETAGEGRRETLIDHCLDRLEANGVEKAIVNVHWLADQIEAHLTYRRSRRKSSSPTSGRSSSTRAAASGARFLEIGRDPFLISNTNSFWIEGPRSNIVRLAEAFDPEAMDFILLVAASAHAVGVDWPGDFTMSHDGRLERRDRAMSRHSSIPGSASPGRNFSPNETDEVFRLAPFFHKAAAGGRLFGLRLDGLWLHVGRPESIAEAERAIDRSTL